jgi:hypothetical protein
MVLIVTSAGDPFRHSGSASKNATLGNQEQYKRSGKEMGNP